MPKGMFHGCLPCMPQIFLGSLKRVEHRVCLLASLLGYQDHSLASHLPFAQAHLCSKTLPTPSAVPEPWPCLWCPIFSLRLVLTSRCRLEPGRALQSPCLGPTPSLANRFSRGRIWTREIWKFPSYFNSRREPLVWATQKDYSCTVIQNWRFCWDG